MKIRIEKTRNMGYIVKRRYFGFLWIRIDRSHSFLGCFMSKYAALCWLRNTYFKRKNTLGINEKRVCFVDVTKEQYEYNVYLTNYSE
jgi:hypothetical protein